MLTSPRKPFARFLFFELMALIAIPAARGQQSEPPALNRSARGPNAKSKGAMMPCRVSWRCPTAGSIPGRSR